MVMPKRSTVLDEVFERPATPHVCDFTHVVEHYYLRDDNGKMWVTNRAGVPMERAHGTKQRPMIADEVINGSPGEDKTVVATTKQQRSRMRRRIKRGMRVVDEAWNELYKPLDEWDAEELARGRPRNSQGNFSGRPPQYVTRELHERAMEKFKTLIRSDMNAQSITALKTIQMVLESEEVDDKGKPIVPAASKMDAAKFLLEHIVGKPTQPTTTDVSVKLQGILGAVMVNPADLGGQYIPAHVGSRELEPGVVDMDDYDPEELDG
jgi:hypothetical protein